MQEVLSEQDLNPQQWEVVNELAKPLLVLSGAGTGKTRVIVNRIAKILRDGFVGPWNILAVTFTNKAALEMRTRLQNFLPDRDISKMWVGTFHGLALRMIKNHGALLGLSNNFSIIDQGDQEKIVKELLAVLSKENRKPVDVKVILNYIGRWKDNGWWPEDVIFDPKSKLEKDALEIYRRYQSSLKKMQGLDFGDMMLYARDLLRTFTDVRQHYENVFKYLLVDEYQDINDIQEEWLNLLSDKANLCCVGDDDQSIYGWRGAQVKNILNFSDRHPGCRIIRLEKNYRSTGFILQVANEVIAVNKNRLAKVLWTDLGEGAKVIVGRSRNPEEEAETIVDVIRDFIAKGDFDRKNIAVLIRSGWQSRVFEENFVRKRIRYKLVGAFKFYDLREIKDAIAYFKLVLNEYDDLAFKRVINVPRRGVGDQTLKIIENHAKLEGFSCFRALEDLLQKGKLKKAVLGSFIEKFEEFKKLKGRADKVGEVILQEYTDSMRQNADDESREALSNIQELLNGMRNYERLEDFVEQAMLLNEYQNKDENGVNILTLHMAKGLEFDCVFLPGWEAGVFPSQYSYGDPIRLEEERRLAYVGITRARFRLFITFCHSRMQYGEYNSNQPSEFLPEFKNNSAVDYYKDFRDFNAENTRIRPEKSSFKVGDLVKHIHYGQGKVIETFNDFLTIEFSNGNVYTILSDYVEA